MRILRAQVARCVVMAGVAVLAGAAAGCGQSASSGQERPQVATAVSPRAGSSAPAASVAAADRPIERPDMSADEKLELSQPWYACEEQAGIKMLRDDKGRRTRPADLLGSVRLRRNADKKCANLLPEELSEHAQRTDPHYLDKFDRWLSCAKSHGVDVHEAPGNPGMLEFPKALPPPDQHQALDKCEMEAFSGS